jgi:hypothetical protein
MVPGARANWAKGVEGVASEFSSRMAGLAAADRSRAARCLPLSFLEHAAQPLSQETALAAQHLWLPAEDSPQFYHGLLDAALASRGSDVGLCSSVVDDADRVSLVLHSRGSESPEHNPPAELPSRAP